MGKDVSGRTGSASGFPTATRSTARGRAVLSPPPPPPAVRLRWLLTALALLVVAALACAYISLCLLFYQGQWQLLYQPSREVRITPAGAGLAFSPVRFGADDAGAPQLTGWWVPGLGSAETILFLHDGSGSLADTVPSIVRLHGLGANVFAIDYRGFGASAGAHPYEASMVEDARSALAYLVETRHLDRRAVLVWGEGVGATIAAEAGVQRRLVLDRVSDPAYQRLRRDPRTRLLPVGLLLRDRLDPTQAIEENHSPKLFLVAARGGTGSGGFSEQLFRQAAEPKSLRGEADAGAILTFVSGPGSGAKP